MNKNELRDQINDNFTNNTQDDFNYLLDVTAEHKNDENFEELFPIIEESLTKLSAFNTAELLISNVDTDFLDNEVIRGKFLLSVDENEIIVNEMADIFQDLKDVFDDNEVYFFNSYIEELIYRSFNPSNKTFRRIEYDLPALHRIYGDALTNLGRNEEAREHYYAALKYNPLDCQARYSYLNNLKKDEHFLEECNKALDYIYDPHYICCLYYMIGKYYLSIGDERTAELCFYYGYYFDLDNFVITHEIFQIALAKQKAIVAPEAEEYLKVFKEKKIKFPPVDKLTKILDFHIQLNKKTHPDLAYVLLDLSYKLTLDKKALEEKKKIKISQMN